MTENGGWREPLHSPDEPYQGYFREVATTIAAEWLRVTGQQTSIPAPESLVPPQLFVEDGLSILDTYLDVGGMSRE